MTPDAYTSDAGSYVLGALSPEESAAFETHLATCRDCREAVDALMALPPLLDAVPADLVLSLARGARLPVDDGADAGPVDHAEEPPPVLLAGLLRRAHQEDELRRRRRSIGLLAVAAVLALAVVLSGSVIPMPWRTTQPGPTVAAEAIEMAQLVPSSVTASVTLEGVRWGTRISLSCRHDGTGAAAGAPGDYSEGAAYSLVVQGADGATEEVATWAAVPGADVTVPASTVITRDDIVLVEVRSADGSPVLRAET